LAQDVGDNDVEGEKRDDEQDEECSGTLVAVLAGNTLSGKQAQTSA
jgi:hypothetical protein